MGSAALVSQKSKLFLKHLDFSGAAGGLYTEEHKAVQAVSTQKNTRLQAFYLSVQWRWQQARMGRIPGELMSQTGTKISLSISNNIHRLLMGGSQPDVQCAVCAPCGFENLSFLGLMGFSQRNEAEDRRRAVRKLFCFKQRNRKMWTSQSCWHLLNCSGKNDVQRLSLTPSASITITNKSLLFSHHSLSVTDFFYCWYFPVTCATSLANIASKTFCDAGLWDHCKMHVRGVMSGITRGFAFLMKEQSSYWKGSSGQATSAACPPLGPGFWRWA